ncbi:hypothetical protein Tco_0643447 [Tanacetum coccineum]
MTTVNQGMSVEEIEWVIARRVANSIEAIAIYKTKTNMARKSMSQTNDKKTRTPTAARNQQTPTCYECGGLGNYKCVDMYWKGKAYEDSSATTSNLNI